MYKIFLQLQLVLHIFHTFFHACKKRYYCWKILHIKKSGMLNRFSTCKKACLHKTYTWRKYFHSNNVLTRSVCTKSSHMLKYVHSVHFITCTNRLLFNNNIISQAQNTRDYDLIPYYGRQTCLRWDSSRWSDYFILNMKPCSPDASG